jgi:hypothetical protein
MHLKLTANSIKKLNKVGSGTRDSSGKIRVISEKNKLNEALGCKQKNSLLGVFL